MSSAGDRTQPANTVSSGDGSASDAWLRRGLYALLAVGVVLRVWQCATRASLWADEAGLALNLIGRDLGEVARPFVYKQVAPYLFLVSEKLVTLVLGESDFALRLFPLLSGLAVLPLAAAIAHRLAGIRCALLTVLLLVPADRLIHYSQELKPYAGDAAIAAGLLLLAQLASERRRALHGLGVLGALVPWFSLPSVFTLAGVGAALIADALWTRRDRRRALLLAGYGALWLASFAVHFRLFLTVASTDTGMHTYYRVMNDFAPFPPHSLADLRWYVGRAFYIFAAPGGFRLRYLAGGLFVVGSVVAWRKQRWLALMFVVPWLAVFATSALKRYALAERMLLFLLPSMFCMIALGLAFMLARQRPALRAFGGLSLIALLASPVFATAHHLRAGVDRPDVEEVVTRLAHELRAGDGLYVDRSNEWVFSFYAKRTGLDAPYVVASGDAVEGDARGADEYVHVLGQLAGKPRVWALLPSASTRLPDTASAVSVIRWAEARLKKRLDELGVPLARHDAGNAVLYLYDFTRSAATAPTPR